MTEQLAIVTITRDRPNLLHQLIECIENTVSIPYTHFIVDDASENRNIPPLLRLLERDRRYIYHRLNRPAGVAGRYNAGLRLAMAGRFPYICMTHDDVLFTKGWAENIIKVFEHDERVFCAVPKFTWATTEEEVTGWKANAQGEIVDQPHYYFWQGFMDFCVFSYECFDVLGLFDERYSIGPPDTDFYFRLLLCHRPQAIVTNSEVIHLQSGGMSPEKKAIYKQRLDVSAVQLCQQWGKIAIDYDADWVMRKSKTTIPWPTPLPYGGNE
jgi:GT2 family glycosyltransferase